MKTTIKFETVKNLEPRIYTYVELQKEEGIYRYHNRRNLDGVRFVTIGNFNAKYQTMFINDNGLLETSIGADNSSTFVKTNEKLEITIKG